MTVLATDIELEAGDGAAMLARAQRLDDEGRRDDAEVWLRRAADGGNLEAMTALGERLLTRPPPVSAPVIDEALKLIVAAAHERHGRAAHLVSLMSAADTTIPDNWTFALAYLGRAAKAGYAPARASLALLARDREVAAALAKGADFPDETWHRLHDAIDATAWLQPPQMEHVSAAPFIAVARGFVPSDVCDWIVARARPKLERALTYDPRDGKGRAGGNRTNSEMRFAFPDLDLAILFQLARAATLTGLPIRSMEPMAVLHYAVGQEFQPHYDFLDPGVPSYAKEIAHTGQRLVTLLVYLSDDFDGGETDFPEIGYRFKGRKGDAILFHNVDRAGAPDASTLHAGRAPTRGEKWLLSQWIRGRTLPG